MPEQAPSPSGGSSDAADTTAVISREPLSEEAERHGRLLQNRYNVDDPKRRIRKLTPGLKKKFCKALAQGASVTKAAQAIGVAKSTAYYQRDIDKQFKEAWDDALDSAADLCEDRLAELREKSTHPAFVFGTLKVLRPEKWGEKKDIKVTHNGPFAVVAPKLTEAQQALLLTALAEDPPQLAPPSTAPQLNEPHGLTD